MSQPDKPTTAPSFKWQPPPRPDWVQRVNEEGDCMDISGVVPLDEQSLLDAAMRATGLSDFGADDWREPFQVLIKSFEEDADLNLMGRLRARSELLLMLTGRLQIEDTYKHHPEIDDERITQPIFVIGQGRSGTSFLINTLAANPENGALLQWEGMYPCPPPDKATYRSEPRIRQAHQRIEQFNRVTPSMATIHEFAGHLPMESHSVMCFNFMGTAWFDAFGQVASYDAYMAKQDIRPAIEYHQRVLKLLQWKNPRKHWVLKDVTLLDHLDTVLKVHPDALFVWTHRDPVRALASTISTVGTLHWAGTDHLFKRGSYEYVTNPELSAARFQIAIDKFESGVVPPQQIYHLLYKDLVGDTIATLAKMYQHFGVALSPEGRAGMEQYLRDNPRTARPAHKFGITHEEAALARKAYRRYEEYFGVPNEG